MTTYSKEQIIGILKAAPEGAQYYTDGYDVKYRKVFGGKYYGYLEEAKGWVETCDKALSQERIDKGWWLVTLASLIENIPTKTPEEKEVLDGIESAGEVEWKSGDIAMLYGDQVLVIAYHPNHPVVVVETNDNEYLNVGINDLSKPETPQQRKDRERLEAAYDLYAHVQSAREKLSCKFDWFFSPGMEETRLRFLAIVDKTNYRKEKSHGTN